METSHLVASIQSGCSWLDEQIKLTIEECLPNVTFRESLTGITTSKAALFQICDGQWSNTNDFNIPLNNPESSLINVFPNNDALTRKNYLSKLIQYWVTKRPNSILKTHVPTTIQLILDYADFVDESLEEADSSELLQSMEANEAKKPSEREWWILKPAMTDCGYGIRIFSTVTDLAGCLELVEPEGEETQSNNGGRVLSSELREFVAQKYITSIPLINRKKFHIRAYIMAIGRLQVFVYKELLVLIASEIYRKPWDNLDLKSSLTNTSLQPEGMQKDSARSFWTLTPDDKLPGDWKESVFQQICQVSAEVFQAASQIAAQGLVLLEGCFEIFALDFLVDIEGSVWLLEVNGGPDFPQEGEAKSLVLRLFESITYVTVGKLVQVNDKSSARERMVEVLNCKLGKCNIREIEY